MKCYKHPSSDAVGICTKCGKAVCAEDSVIVSDKLYCVDCAPSIKEGSVTATKRLYRSKKNAILGGVCGGIAEYFQIDPTLVRLLWVLSIFAGMGLGVIAYIVCWIVIPLEP